MILPETINLKEGSERWGCSERTLREAVLSGNIIAFNAGRRWMLDIESGDKWYMSKTVRPRIKKGRPRNLYYRY